VTRPVPTAEFASLVYGADGVPLDDPAESFHEASRLYPNVAPGRLATLLTLSRSPELQQTTLRASRKHPHRPSLPLPPPERLRVRLRDALDRRRSHPPDVSRPLRLTQLSALLDAAYRARVRRDSGPRRLVPSGGALYPLEVYVLALDVAGVAPVAAHYDPFRHRVELLRPLERADVAAAVVDATVVSHAAAVVVVTGMFWRSRFKYGVRGYRFALLEAGHVVQNLVLAAAALRVAALPLGGFYDRRVDALVGADGLDEAAVYAVVLGGSP
jgi:SagB-type dehydrogenase family enzyme